MTILVWALLLVAAGYGAAKAFRDQAAFVVFLMAGGILRFSSVAGDVGAGSLDLSAFWLLCLIALCIVALFRSGALAGRFSVPERLYLLFLAWCLIEGLRAASFPFAVRSFLKLLYPPLGMILARHVVRSTSTAQSILKWTMGAAFLSYVLIGGVTERFALSVTFGVAPFLWAGAPFADYAAIMTVVALVSWQYFDDKRFLYLAVLLGTSSLFVSIRTGILGVAVGIAAMTILRRGVRSLPMLAIIYLLAASALFLLPDVRAKMFNGHESQIESTQLVLHPEDISTGDIDSSGRFTMWQVVMDKFFWPNPIIGSGLGSTQAWFYGGGYIQVKIEHSEYVKLLSDTGIIGLGLFLSVLVSSAIISARLYRRSTNSAQKVFALAATATVPALMVCMAFDNALLYVCAVAQYPLMFCSIAIGLNACEPAIEKATKKTDQRLPMIPVHRSRPRPVLGRAPVIFADAPQENSTPRAS